MIIHFSALDLELFNPIGYHSRTKLPQDHYAYRLSTEVLCICILLVLLILIKFLIRM